MSRSGTLLLQFAREPVAGGVKTRLLPALSAQEACDLHTQLVKHTSEQLLQSGLGPVQLSVAGDPGAPVFLECQAAGVQSLTRQCDGDLGQRMLHGLRSGLRDFARVVLVGSDCPAIDPTYLSDAVDSLLHHPVVVGPAEDGGFVLIGAREVRNGWFEGVRWGADDVCARVMANIEGSAVTCGLLPERIDIDRPEDLPEWERVQALMRRKRH